MNNLVVKEVNFENVSMTACKTIKGKIFVGIRSICEGLGIDYSSQLKRINRDDVLPQGVVKMTMPTNSGEQEVNMLDIEYLPFFLTGIKSSMVKSEIAPKIIEFKLKAKDVLADAFLNKPQCIEDVLIQSLQEMKDIKQQLNQVNNRVLQANAKAEETKNDIQAMRDVISLNPNAWRTDARNLIVKIAVELGGNAYIRDVNREIYTLLNTRMGVNLGQRLTNKRRRMADEGVCKSKRDKLNKLDIIADDKKLIEGYITIVKEMAIKYKVA